MKTHWSNPWRNPKPALNEGTRSRLKVMELHISSSSLRFWLKREVEISHKGLGCGVAMRFEHNIHPGSFVWTQYWTGFPPWFYLGLRPNLPFYTSLSSSILHSLPVFERFEKILGLRSIWINLMNHCCAHHQFRVLHPIDILV